MSEQEPSRTFNGEDTRLGTAGAAPTPVRGQLSSGETEPRPTRAPRVLIFVPGLGAVPWNTAERVADVIAGGLSRTRAGTYTAERSTTATAPRSLKVGKVIRSPDGQPLLEVVELDYRHRLDDIDPDTGEPKHPLGFVRASLLAIVVGAKVTRAFRHPAKSAMAKLQLLFGLGCVAALFVTAAVAAVAALTAMGFGGRLPSWLSAEQSTAQTTALAAGGSVAIVWWFVRSQALQVTRSTRCMERYVDDGRHRATVTQALDEAVDGLCDTVGQGVSIHVLAYSFGSLLAVDALFPEEPAAPSRLETVATLMTLGCPVDMIQLFAPDFYARRSSRNIQLRWVNVYIPADVFGSTFENRTKGRRGRSGGYAPPRYTPDVNIRYTHDELSMSSLLRWQGFTTHAGYWERAGEASCFDYLLDEWVPEGGEAAPAEREPQHRTPHSTRSIDRERDARSRGNGDPDSATIGSHQITNS